MVGLEFLPHLLRALLGIYLRSNALECFLIAVKIVITDLQQAINGNIHHLVV